MGKKNRLIGCIVGSDTSMGAEARSSAVSTWPAAIFGKEASRVMAWQFYAVCGSSYEPQTDAKISFARCDMSRHAEQATLPYSADELFGVVADVKHYPLFVPWCSAAHIRHADEREIIAELVIGFGPFQESFTSHVALDRPRQVQVRAVEGGPLEHLTNTWTFTPIGEKTHVDFIIDFEFKSHLLNHVANGMFGEAATRMMSAFRSRVHLLHMMRRRPTQGSTDVR
jgi:coenzyme Q-binding protein COQ10